MSEAKRNMASVRGQKKPRSVVYHIVRCRNGSEKRLRLTPRIAQAVACTECMGWEDDPKNCPATLCPHWPFRRKTLLTQRGDLCPTAKK